ncbi:MAG TPA: hypothetical protein VFE62_12290 [Gemmataceae bacterium]|nr:hypothetical protein [Pirellulales bacterium]HZZ79292.1 hypothetical protein [Gemmataceae bacterium]
MTLTPDDRAVIRAIVRDELRLAMDAFAGKLTEVFRPAGEALVRRCEQLDSIDRTLTQIINGQALLERWLIEVDQDE